jgi:hypothetical protein
MKFHKSHWLVVYTMLTVILSSCNLGATPVPTLDVGAIQTQAFSQVLTQVALANTPTPMPTNTLAPTVTLSAPPTFAPVGGGVETPIPFNTPQPGLTPLAIALSPVATLSGGMLPTKNGCNDGIYKGESAPYDGSVLDPSHGFQKNFTYQNIGTCTWDEGYALVFMPDFSTPGFKGYDIVIKKPEDFTKPLGFITFSLKLTSSVVAGEHTGAWKLRDDGGNYFGSMVRVNYIIGTRADRGIAAETATKAAEKTATAAAK